MLSRRSLLVGGMKRAVSIGAAVAMTALTEKAHAAFAGFLEGTWIVRCKNGHDDQVDGITRNHDCEKCGDKAVDDGNASVVCPDGHATRVGGVTRVHDCNFALPSGGVCGKQCRRG